MRRLDWPERLAGAVEAAQHTPFAWGSHDCVLWACTVAQAMTDIDPAAAFRGTYHGIKGALLVLQELGGGDFEAAIEAVCAAHGFARIAPQLAQRGDAVLCPSGVASWPQALGICLGRVAVLAGPAGLVRLPMTTATAAWRVG